MAGIKCMFVDSSGKPCELDALHKCSGRWCNGGVYCVMHIQLLSGEYICDQCRQKAVEREKEETRRAIDANLWGGLTFLYISAGGIVLLLMSCTLSSQPGLVLGILYASVIIAFVAGGIWIRWRWDLSEKDASELGD